MPLPIDYYEPYEDPLGYTNRDWLSYVRDQAPPQVQAAPPVPPVNPDVGVLRGLMQRFGDQPQLPPQDTVQSERGFISKGYLADPGIYPRRNPNTFAIPDRPVVPPMVPNRGDRENYLDFLRFKDEVLSGSDAVIPRGYSITPDFIPESRRMAEADALLLEQQRQEALRRAEAQFELRRQAQPYEGNLQQVPGPIPYGIPQLPRQLLPR